MITFLYFFFRSAHVSSLSCFPVFGLYIKKSFFLGFTSFTRIAVFLLFLIWKKKKKKKPNINQKLPKLKHNESICLSDSILCSLQSNSTTKDSNTPLEHSNPINLTVKP